MTRKQVARVLGVKKSYLTMIMLGATVGKQQAKRLSEITGIDVRVFLYQEDGGIKHNLEKIYGVFEETRGGGGRKK